MVWPHLKIFWFSKDDRSYRAQCKEREEAGDRRRGGKSILQSVQEWTLPSQLGQLKTGQGKSSVVPRWLYKVMEYNRIEQTMKTKVNKRVSKSHLHCAYQPGRVAQLVARPTQEPEVPGSIPGPATYFCFFFR